MTNERSHDIAPDLLRIADNAYGRYQSGYSIRDAIAAACYGKALERVEIAAIEAMVMTQICKAEGDGSGLVQIEAQIERVRSDRRRILPVLDRARDAKLHPGEAAVLAAAAHHDPLWELLQRVSAGGSRITIGPIDPKAADLADRQSKLARHIADADFDARIVAVIHVRQGNSSAIEIDALAAATTCVEIHHALAQVRMVVTMTRTERS